MPKGFWIFLIILLVLLFVLFSLFPGFFGLAVSYDKSEQETNIAQIKDTPAIPVIPPLDPVAYDKKIKDLANNPPPPVVVQKFDEVTGEPIPPPPPKPILWPVKTVYPNAGAILPFNRIVAYYGNLYSTKMGALGQYSEAEMFQRLEVEMEKWKNADPATPVIPALHYIAVVAQGSPGENGKYRARMPDSEIDKVLAMAARINAIVFLDFQVGFSTLAEELPVYEKYFKLPDVHLGIDPEFSMKGTSRPGKVVGTLDASDINFAAHYLANLVKENNLTPKILVIHRYTQKMVTNYKQIEPLPEVQIIMHMDGWGRQAKKLNTYQQFIYKEPVQFTGFKLFYKNDIFEAGTALMTPETLLKLSPRPIYIQYQ
ncbi:hypothetical protein A2443_02630 [Candidatus Nomurabacteria bacterium RIFOXYC2_FULL_43_16]|uniref:Lipoprotein n=1 Tax=Candidatus Nomurabacteria bacterium RIFOXYA2_FULL_42_12 TaxID=1801801 RepID=A0A1F6YLL4_9BACT|nr:MAG: hypothetical protein A2357_00750 [Candidatus Nomurabacteria bacterium RIFOXYB1_FULL_43_14]OGJ07256.1 MAG: hypothetical protein A2225_01820 [Candidatus Nomurabacteria bacterium RIFOXYA2_FULL_42_12]OGJ07690.1 MAG: hypothetical protein A2183_00180 [Candidatus Nomurabacteria bacterium RIFOXYA1_FULL_42_12]OGJ10098.1 MAG: hypothetical protein A2443_02630 [Candidatus Nomurabacteria bacterium RIFOXYC2_FULL_43_16]OGJ13707.1 MAG: hypothetical protein A2587_02345 [Candidatus Nomurabacteria bacteri